MEAKRWHIVTMLIFAALAAFSFWILCRAGVSGFSLTWFELVVLALAVFRLTYLVVYDSIMDFFRDLFKDSEGLKASMHELVTCPWCTGVWMALLVLFFFFLHPASFYFILIAAVAGSATGISGLVRFIQRS